MQDIGGMILTGGNRGTALVWDRTGASAVRGLATNSLSHGAVFRGEMWNSISTRAPWCAEQHYCIRRCPRFCLLCCL